MGDCDDYDCYRERTRKNRTKTRKPVSQEQKSGQRSMEKAEEPSRVQNVKGFKKIPSVNFAGKRIVKAGTHEDDIATRKGPNVAATAPRNLPQPRRRERPLVMEKRVKARATKCQWKQEEWRRRPHL